MFSEVLPDGTSNGIPVFDKPWKNVVATFYRCATIEAPTDPDVEDAIKAGSDPAGANFLGWVSQQGEECGDFPVFEASPLTLVSRKCHSPTVVGPSRSSSNIPTAYTAPKDREIHPNRLCRLPDLT